MEAEKKFEIQKAEKECQERVQEIELNLRRAESQLHFKTRTLADVDRERNRLLSNLKRLEKRTKNISSTLTPTPMSQEPPTTPTYPETPVSDYDSPTPYDILNANDALSTLMEHFREVSSRSYSKLLKWIHDSRRETKSIAMKSRLSQILCEFVRGVIYNEKEEFEMSSPLSIVLKALKILERCVALSNVRDTQSNTTTRIRIEGSSQNATRLRQAVKDLQDSNISTDDDTSCMPFLLKSLRTLLTYTSQDQEKDRDMKKARLDLSIAFVNICFESVSSRSITSREREETLFVLNEQLKFWCLESNNNIKGHYVLKCRVAETLHRLCEDSRLSKYMLNNTDVLITVIRMLKSKQKEDFEEEQYRMELQIVRLLFSLFILRRVEFLKVLRRSTQVANESLTELLSRVPEISHGRSRSWLVPKLVLVLIRASRHVEKSRITSILVREIVTFLSGLFASYPRFVNELVVSGLRFKLLSVLLSIHRKELKFRLENTTSLCTISHSLMMDVGVSTR